MVKKNTGSSGPGGRYSKPGAGGSQKRKLMLGLNKEFFKIDSKYVVH